MFDSVGKILGVLIAAGGIAFATGKYAATQEFTTTRLSSSDTQIESIIQGLHALDTKVAVLSSQIQYLQASHQDLVRGLKNNQVRSSEPLN